MSQHFGCFIFMQLSGLLRHLVNDVATMASVLLKMDTENA
jgi:hypothetical protein